MRPARFRRYLLYAMAFGFAAGASSTGTLAAFLSTTVNEGNGMGNSFDAGTVDLVDDDGGSALFTISGARPADPPVQRCISVTYNGSLDSTVVLYGSSSGALAPYLNLTVSTGTTSSSFSSCAGFTETQVLYSGTLAAFPGSYGSGILDPDPAWTTGESHAYRFVLSVQDTPSAEGHSASATFTWEARNL